MAQDKDFGRARPVPAGRFERMLRLGGMTSAILGDAVASSVRQVARGERPSLRQALLTPSTAARLARDLGRMRGAAMKLGQMLSMDTGVVLPPELASALESLRADAPPMPAAQLQAVLDAEWGAGWRARFAAFDMRPFAAASIGQVHRATARDGRPLAIKVQYPGVRASIDSDIDNLAALFRLPGLLPPGMYMAPLLAEAKRQLHREADYRAEAASLARFRDCLAGDEAFVLPQADPALSTDRILAMSYVPGVPIEWLADKPQPWRDRVAAKLVELVLRELFEFGLMQSDPNLANYRFDPASGRIVLLDFGAVMEIGQETRAKFRRLLAAGLDGERRATRDAMLQIGYFDRAMAPRHQALILGMFEMAMQPLRQPEPFDFGTSDLIERLRDMGQPLGGDRDIAHVPPPETLFLHRKIGGIYLMAARLRARVALAPLVERWR